MVGHWTKCPPAAQAMVDQLKIDIASDQVLDLIIAEEEVSHYQYALCEVQVS